jgi:3-oxoacyl-[acyl-carrier-protein] synthase II
MNPSNVVITGIGVVSAIGMSGDAYFDSLLNLRSGIQSLAARTDDGAKPNGDATPAGLWIGAPVVDFDPKPFVRPRKALKVMCREIQTAFVASQLAIMNANLESLMPCDPAGKIKPDRVGAVFGSEMLYGPPKDMVDSFSESVDENGVFDPSRFGAAAMRGVMPLWMLKYLPNMPACHIGIAVNAHGPNNSLILGDVSGPAALMEASSYISRGVADLMITGSTGTRINTTRLNYRNDLPIADVTDPISRCSRPHDPSSLGVIGGEGAAALIIESSQHAAQREVDPIALIAGSASRFIASDAIRYGHRTNASHPPNSRGSSEAITLAIKGAIDQAHRQFGYTASDIGAILSHGMGDPCTDGAEERALRQILPDVPVVAPIASIGHTGAASGGISIATAALSLARRTILPTLNAERSENVHLLSKSQPLTKSCVICLSHTSDGSATAIVLATP